MLIQRCSNPHSAIDNPDITDLAMTVPPSSLGFNSLEQVVASGIKQPDQQVLITEAYLLDKWQFSDQWEKYLDAPLISHADAALTLQKKGYDGVVSIEDAGNPYADIFGIMGMPVVKVDYSFHRRNMTQPEADQDDLINMQRCQKVLLVDIDVVTGTTASTVVNYLYQNKIDVKGVYTGLHAWPGIEMEEPHIGEDTVNFRRFSSCSSSTSGLRYVNQKKRDKIAAVGILPDDLEIFCPNPISLDNASSKAVARKVAKYFVGRQ